jgi:acetyltransferase-like isoleucine patch superfamily enzyme
MSSDATPFARDGATANAPAGDLTYHGGTVSTRGNLFRAVERVTPSIVKAKTKRVHKWVHRTANRALHMHTARFVELGRRFRFDRNAPYTVRVGEHCIAEDFNVWNAGSGDIVVGAHCWFGLHNIVMGPVKIGDRLSTGPYVSILGPRHPTFRSRVENPPCTVIGDDVWISAGAIILSGAVIGNGAVIGAGSVVSGRVPANATYIETRNSHVLPRFS